MNNQGITAMFCGHLHRYIYAEPNSSLHDFPIIINGHNTSLEIKANSQNATVIRKDTDGKELGVLSFD